MLESKDSILRIELSEIKRAAKDALEVKFRPHSKSLDQVK
jgi:hypothetical protein